MRYHKSKVFLITVSLSIFCTHFIFGQQNMNYWLNVEYGNSTLGGIAAIKT